MKRIDFDTLKFLLKENRGKKVLLTFHSIGDNDAISSAFALAKYFTMPKVVMPDAITANAMRVMRRFGFNPDSVSREFDEKAELVVLVDVNNFEDCGAFRYRLEEFRGTILIIDHHAKHELAGENVFVFDDESYNSAASIVTRLLEETEVKIDVNTAGILLAGILSDSAELKNATPDTFMQMGKLLKIAGMNYVELVDLMTHVADPYSREKTIKDIRNAAVEIRGDLLFIHGKAHAHANIAADLSVKLGADVAIFYAQSEREVSFSGRLRPPLDKRLGLHLGVILRTIAPMMGPGGHGGGHPAAAGAYGPLTSNPEAFVSIFIEEIIKRMKK